MSIESTVQPLYMRGCDPVQWQRVSGRLNKLLSVHFGLAGSSFAPHVRLDEDLALDSLDLVDFGMLLGDQFEIELSIEELRLTRTVGDMTSLITAALYDKAQQG